MILLYTDEDTTPLLARALRAAGRDAVSAHDINARQLTDEEQLELATSQSRAIVTSNYGDFLRLSKGAAQDGQTHGGIIVSFRQLRPDNIGPATQALLGLCAHYDEIGLNSCLVVLEDYWPQS